MIPSFFYARIILMMMIMMMTTDNYNDKNKFVEEHLTWQIAK